MLVSSSVVGRFLVLGEEDGLSGVRRVLVVLELSVEYQCLGPLVNVVLEVKSGCWFFRV